MILFTNIMLRPLAQKVNKTPNSATEEENHYCIEARLTSVSRSDDIVEEAVSRLSFEPGVSAVREIMGNLTIRAGIYTINLPETIFGFYGKDSGAL